MDDITWLQRWYANQCDGDWEHEWGVRVETLDNPGWHLIIDLLATELEGRPFERFEHHDSELSWIVCSIKEKKVDVARGPGNLGDALRVFRTWASSPAGTSPPTRSA